MGNEQFGIDIHSVRSIERLTEITPIPQSENYIKGIIHLRNDVIPIIDLKKKLKMSDETTSNGMQIIIVHIDDMPIGLLIDEARDVLDINRKSIEKPKSAILTDDQAIEGIVKLESNLILLLKVDNMFHAEDLNRVYTTIKNI